jgi:hypothetical protein
MSRLLLLGRSLRERATTSNPIRCDGQRGRAFRPLIPDQGKALVVPRVGSDRVYVNPMGCDGIESGRYREVRTLLRGKTRIGNNLGVLPVRNCYRMVRRLLRGYM